jgi:hypothetical protein
VREKMAMKNFLKIFLVALLMSAKVFAQTQAFAISSVSGILESKYKVTYFRGDKHMRNNNSVADTISMEEAQSIFTLNALGIDTNKILNKLQVKDFTMLLDYAGDTASFKSNSEMLTAEMKTALKKIKPGTTIYFEYIRARWGEFLSNLSMIKYYVK